MNSEIFSRFEQYCNSDPFSYADMYDMVNFEGYHPIYADEEGILITDEEEKSYVLAAENEECAKPIIELINEPDTVVTHLDAVIPTIQKAFSLPNAKYCSQFVYNRARPLTSDAPIGMDIRPLTEDDWEYVYTNTTKNEEYVLDRIEYGMWGVVYNGELCGCVGFHDEGAIGMLFVGKECRRLGAGMALMALAVDRRISEGRVPYDHVVLGNIPSEKLQSTLGFAKAEKPAIWIYK